MKQRSVLLIIAIVSSSFFVLEQPAPAQKSWLFGHTSWITKRRVDKKRVKKAKKNLKTARRIFKLAEKNMTVAQKNLLAAQKSLLIAQRRQQEMDELTGQRDSFEEEDEEAYEPRRQPFPQEPKQPVFLSSKAPRPSLHREEAVPEMTP